LTDFLCLFFASISRFICTATAFAALPICGYNLQLLFISLHSHVRILSINRFSLKSQQVPIEVM